MLIAIYFILKGIFSNVLGDVFSTIGVILIMGFGISLMVNALTHNSHATDSYINGMRTGFGRVARIIYRGLVQLFRIVFYRAPRWVYRKVNTFLNGKVGDVPRVILSALAAVLTVIVII